MLDEFKVEMNFGIDKSLVPAFRGKHELSKRCLIKTGGVAKTYEAVVRNKDSSVRGAHRKPQGRNSRALDAVKTERKAKL